jgi:tRNA uridine 5-carbamoylmethylation protein Kti12
MATLTLVRGLPGSGKSTIARNLAWCPRESIHLEADMYFVKDGVYQFDSTQLGQAHEWCQNQTKQYLKRNFDVVVSNTFTTVKELARYFEIAKELSIIPNVIIAQNQFQNTHNVPAETLKKMSDRFAWDISELFNM